MRAKPPAMDEFYLLAADDTEAAVIVSRVVVAHRLGWIGWLIEPIDPAPPRPRRLLSWWQPRMRLYRVHRTTA